VIKYPAQQNKMISLRGSFGVSIYFHLFHTRVVRDKQNVVHFKDGSTNILNKPSSPLSVSQHKKPSTNVDTLRIIDNSKHWLKKIILTYQGCIRPRCCSSYSATFRLHSLSSFMQIIHSNYQNIHQTGFALFT
jgi:hypothetical protein